MRDACLSFRVSLESCFQATCAVARHGMKNLKLGSGQKVREGGAVLDGSPEQIKMSLAEVQVSERSLASGGLIASLNLVCAPEPLMHRLLHAPDFSWLIQGLFHDAVWRNQVANPQAAVEIFAHDVSQRVPAVTATH